MRNPNRRLGEQSVSDVASAGAPIDLRGQECYRVNGFWYFRNPPDLFYVRCTNPTFQAELDARYNLKMSEHCLWTGNLTEEAPE